MPRKPPIARTRKPPPVSVVYERAVARQFLDAGYDLHRRGGRIVLAKDGHAVPLYQRIALDFELRAPQLILDS